MAMIAAILQARMSSSRLPGKVLMKVDDSKTVIEYVVEQLRHSKLIDKIIIATSDNPEDDKIFDTVTECGTECFRGSLDDVLDRYYRCAKKFSSDTIVRITCDNPLIDPTIVDKVVNQHRDSFSDVTTNTKPRTFPYGTETEVFSFQALEKAWMEARTDFEREHVTPYFYNNQKTFSVSNVASPKKLSFLRWTVDILEDLDFVRFLVKRINHRPILTEDVLDTITRYLKS